MIDKIGQICSTFFESASLDDCFLVEVKVNKHSKKIEVFVDSDTAINFSICKRLSRLIEAYLDEEKYNDGAYTLDVSSPGLDNPLVLQRQYLKNIGRDIKVLTIEKETIKGELKFVDANKIIVFTSKKKKKELIEKEYDLPFDQIKTAKILAKF